MNDLDGLPDVLSRLLPAELDLLRQLVGINSFTANREGVNRVGGLMADAFAGLGFTAERVASENPAYGDHLVLTRPGRTGRTIGLVTHLDTVFPAEEEERNEFRWRPVGDRIYGPGTMDIKGGTAMIHLVLSGLRKCAPSVFDEITWKVLANSSEEVLSHDFGRVCLDRLGQEALASLVFECEGRCGPNTALVVARKGRATFRVHAEGRAAHAGGRHHHGANAIVQLSEAVGRIAGFTDYERDLTFNVGTIRGGTVTNRVPHEASADLEMRAFGEEAYQSGVGRMATLNGEGAVRAADDGFACRLRVELISETAPWPPNPGSERLFGIWQSAGHELGHLVFPERRGGLSDGNLVWHGVPTLDGLGPWGENDHCSERSPDGSKDQEYVDVRTFVPKALLNVRAIVKLVG